MKKYFLKATLLLMGLMGTLAIGVVNAQEINKDIILEATSTEANQTLKINKYFANAYTVDWGDGTTGNLTANTTHTYATAGTYTITLSLSGADRWIFKTNYQNPLVPKNGTTMTGVRIVYMPSLADGFGSGVTNVGNYFFYCFNYNGALTSLPEGSFDTSNITTVGNYSFDSMNRGGLLIALPEGSFDTSQITTVGTHFFRNFNREGQITSLPANSFDISKITTVGNYFFDGFNYGGKITNLPTGSFDTSNIISVGSSFFGSFNGNGLLESLPEYSFKFSTGLISANNYFFVNFNYKGAIESLPEGSFDISNITVAGTYFFAYFNLNGRITDLPESFKLNSTGASQISGYDNAFNSTGYTLNRKVSDLVSGVTAPSNDMNTFSDNQPGRCGVADNWLVNPATACKTVTFETNSGSTVDSQVVDIDANEMVIKPTDPTKTGHIFTGWYSDENLTEVFDFSTVIADDTTLYAKWQVNQYTITLDIDGMLTTITGDYDSPVNKPADPTKNGYTFKGWEPEIPDTMPAENITVKAKWEKISGGSSGGGGRSNKNSDNSEKSSEQPTGSQVDSSEQTPQNDSNTSMDSSTSSQNDGKTYTPEFQEAYEFAKGNGITTMPTIQKADMNGKLTRIAMAKMLSQYAINVLGKTPDTTQNKKFNDVTDKRDVDYDNGVTLAYQLGIMGQNMPGNNFRPDDEVSRAEFATALSRMLYNTSDGQYKSTDKYYTNHMSKLVKEGIITKDDPKMKELRGYVMIMLMRSAK